MIISEDLDQAEFVNKGHEKSNGKNISVLVSFDDFDYIYNFKIGYLSMDVNPLASIAGDDTPEPCFDPILSGTANVDVNGKVIGKTDKVPNYLNNPRTLHDIKIGLQLVNHNLPQYDLDIADKRAKEL